MAKTLTILNSCHNLTNSHQARLNIYEDYSQVVSPSAAWRGQHGHCCVMIPGSPGKSLGLAKPSLCGEACCLGKCRSRRNRTLAKVMPIDEHIWSLLTPATPSIDIHCIWYCIYTAISSCLLCIQLRDQWVEHWGLKVQEYGSFQYNGLALWILGTK